MLKNLALPALVALMALLPGCMASTDDINASQAELRNGIDIVFIDYDTRREAFTVGIELENSVLRNRDARYLVTELSYMEPNGAGVSPFAAAAVADVRLRPISRTHSSAELIVEGPRPRNPEDVVGYVSANPTPHP
ncbi:MAG: hypothetical protein AB8I08_20135 [Sandaracinaceae bacterium]